MDGWNEGGQRLEARAPVLRYSVHRQSNNWNETNGEEKKER